MHIAKYLDLSLLRYLLSQVLSRPKNGLQIWGRLLPFPVLVKSSQISPLITMNDPINVKHWYDIDDVIFTEGFCMLVIG